MPELNSISIFNQYIKQTSHTKYTNIVVVYAHRIKYVLTNTTQFSLSFDGCDIYLFTIVCSKRLHTESNINEFTLACVLGVSSVLLVLPLAQHHKYLADEKWAV